MSRFVLKAIEEVSGNKPAYKQLVILSDSADSLKVQKEIDRRESKKEKVEWDGVLDIYEKTLESKYKSSYRRLLTIMNRVANGELVSQDKFKNVTPPDESVSEYEYKYQDLRVWAFKIPGGHLVTAGGYKNDQQRGFNRFRSLKTAYLTSLKKNKK